MTITVNGTNGLTFSDASTQASAQVGMKNRIIDGGFIVNQRTYVSGTALGVSMAYGHDRWKGGSGGGTYTFTQGALGVNTTITITAGTIMQVIEGCNLPEGGTYVLSWTGTAQGRLNGGTYGSSGTVTVTGWTAGTNLNVEFNTGTLGSVQLEKGSTATSFDYRPYGTELALCQRYFEVVQVTSTNYGNGSSGVYCQVPFRAVKRATPTMTDVGFSYGGYSVANATNNVSPTFADNFSTALSGALALGAGSGFMRYNVLCTASAEL